MVGSGFLLRNLLWVDCGAALVAGLLVLSLSEWLGRLYAMPQELLVGIGVANLCFGVFSFSLAWRQRRPRSLIVLLVVANTAWAVLCALAALRLAGTASVFGLAHLVGEGLFVGGLARVEWIQRERLIVGM